MCERWEGLGVTPAELLKPGTAVMVPVGMVSAVVNGGPCVIAWARVRGPAEDHVDPEGTIRPDSMWWLDVHMGPGAVLAQMYRADQILGVPAMGLSMAEPYAAGAVVQQGAEPPIGSIRYGAGWAEPGSPDSETIPC